MRKLWRRAVALVSAPMLFFAARVGALWALSALFEAWNLNARTYAYAPAWARQIADLAGDIADATGLIAGSVALIFLIPRREKAGARRLAASLATGAALGGGLLAILLAAGSVYLAHWPTFAVAPAGLALLSEAALWLGAALWLRGALAPLCRGAGKWAAGLASAMGQAALFLLMRGACNATLVLTGLLTGALFFLLAERTGSALCEAALCLGFRLAERVVWRYPDLGWAYPVSEPWLTGENAGGLMGSGLFLLCLLLLAGSMVLRRLFYKR